LHLKRSLVGAVLTASAIAIASTSVHAADASSITSLSWLAGCWNSENAEPGSGEQWMPLAGNSLLGMGRTIRGGSTAAHEFMRIAEAPDGKLTFFAQPSGKPPASFAVHKLGPNEVVFENLEHPFPQRIIYRFEPPAKLHASIEGTRNGANKSFVYRMLRVSCDAWLQSQTRP
jgi:hypothetical protein